MQLFSYLVGLLIKSTQFFSVVVLIYRGLVIGEAFFSSLETVTMKSQKVSFSCFLVKYWNKFLQHNYAACQSKLCLLTKNYWWYVFYPFAKDPDHGVKMWQNLVLFFLAFIIYLSGFDLFSLSNFPNFRLMDNLDISS